MITKHGSQNREPLSESGYHVMGWIDAETVILQANDDPKQMEVWFEHDDHAGYTIEIDGVGFEFARDYKLETDSFCPPRPLKEDSQIGCLLVFKKGINRADVEKLLDSFNKSSLDCAPIVEEFDPVMGSEWRVP